MATRNRSRDMGQDVLDELTALALAPEHLTAAKIRRRLVSNPNFAGRVREIRTIERAVADVRAKATLLDMAFEYHRLEEYDLPWEAGPYILQMWAWVREGGTLPSGAIERGFSAPIPTAREATWWWRIHLVDPELTNESVWRIAGWFAQREWAEVFQGVKLSLADLEAYLAYRPWRSDEERKIYERAISEDRIPRINEDRSYFVRTIID